MNNKTGLVLIEQLVMLLVFALCAAVILSVFTAAYGINRQAEDLDTAVHLAQMGAEALKASVGNLESTARMLGGTVQGNLLTVSFDAQLTAVPRGTYLLFIEETYGTPSTIGQADIRVTLQGTPDIPLFSLVVAWQEETT